MNHVPLISSALAKSARPTFGESLRVRLIHGLLLPPSGSISGGPATGKPCVVCSETIVNPEIEYELDLPQLTFVHLACYKLWLEEARRLAGQLSPSPRKTRG